MLSLFPELLFLAPFSALLIRLAAAAVVGYIAIQHIQVSGKSLRAVGVVEGVCAILFFLGLYTQAASLLGIMIGGIHVLNPRVRILPMSTMLLFLIMSLSLLVTGAGPFTLSVAGMVFPLSMDLPL